jgi:flagellar protein FliS
MNPYFEQTILNAGPIELTAMVYQRAIACVQDAREHLRHGRVTERSASIMRAYAAVAELLSALRPENAPELAGHLGSLYLYIQQRMLDGNLRQADQPLEEALGLLSMLAESWSAVAAQLRMPEETPETIPAAFDGGSRVAIHA